jgi:hypothetical protein
MGTFTDKYNILVSDFTQAFEQYEFPISYNNIDESDKLVLEVYNEVENEYRVVTLNGINTNRELITDDGDYLFHDLKIESMVKLLDYLT